MNLTPTVTRLGVALLVLTVAASFGSARSAPAASPSADLWVIGLEVNQGFQDMVHTHIRAAGPGGRTITPTDPRPTSPLIPGKPALVRVYVGLRTLSDSPVPYSSVTGRLFADVHNGSAPLALLPIVSTTGPSVGSICDERTGSVASACELVIRVFPTLGRQGLATNNDHDLDLIDARAVWWGTLNFVVPPDVTAKLRKTGRLTLRAVVNPVAGTESKPPDNEFVLDHRNVAEPRPLRVRVVRVKYKSLPAPGSAAARRALENMFRLLPYSQLHVVSDNEFAWDGSRIRIKIGPLSLHKLTECQSLWIRLYRRYGLNPDVVLYALYPNNSAVDFDCTGLGANVPLPGGRGGGIGFSQIPSDDAATSEDNRELLAIMAQELYHAVFRRSHVSNNHSEAGGCILHGSVVLKALSALSHGKYDCARPSPYPHGALGGYPEDPGNKLISGVRGSMAIDLRPRTTPNGTFWDVTLHDPCPTGSIRPNPLGGVAKRWDFVRRGYRCTLDDETHVPHDFMSYGDHRWTSRAQFFGGPRLVGIAATIGGSK